EGQKITSPATLTGRITGVDENVSISLVTQDGRTIGTASAPAGSGAPWAATISWTDRGWYTGALVLKTYSPKDGALNRLIVLRVTRGR
ncbi:MAG: Immunoglobulin-like domain of bacterial spore germination, partial [Frankiales bacterium]|nr:Immunoglobulin-like domain of bacterial spore germination [Frankiales bacterium]